MFTASGFGEIERLNTGKNAYAPVRKGTALGMLIVRGVGDVLVRGGEKGYELLRPPCPQEEQGNLKE